jgi:asparagine synthetase B (glutamine-hydrolysing)
MCGIFGQIGSQGLDSKTLIRLARHAQQRGLDSSGVVTASASSGYSIYRADFGLTSLLKKVPLEGMGFAMGHSRLITNGMDDNQPIRKGGVLVLHNGIVLNEDAIWSQVSSKRELSSDTESIAAIADGHLSETGSLKGVGNSVLGLIKGSASCVVASPGTGELALFSNTGSLFYGTTESGIFFASEKYALESAGCKGVRQVFEETILEIPRQPDTVETNLKSKRPTLLPKFEFVPSEEKLLVFDQPEHKRCQKCILPSTMPFIYFDDSGVCNYCQNYKTKGDAKPIEGLAELVEPYRRAKGADVILPFSGGRDSSFGLHIASKVLGLKPIAYTYDWGMVTDLGRRNISLMCAELGVENIVFAADIAKKRAHIRANLSAWLKSPHLGMVSLLTAGDKHFFRHIETVKKQTGIELNLWGINPLETTHFKAGFLGIKPDFEQKNVYASGLSKQVVYHSKRLAQMLKNPSYFNSSIYDTLSGEYFRSRSNKTGYHHIFDYWKWDETEINQTLVDEYGWELATDTTSTWRIGDATASFYNYVYFTVAGFSEHDTFRSNQIRENVISRDEALKLVGEENKPRYESIKWYLDAVGIDFSEAVSTINRIPKL